MTVVVYKLELKLDRSKTIRQFKSYQLALNCVKLAQNFIGRCHVSLIPDLTSRIECDCLEN